MPASERLKVHLFKSMDNIEIATLEEWISDSTGNFRKGVIPIS
jgi:hypothetical protein